MNRFEVSQDLRLLMLGFIALGLVCLGIGFVLDHKRAWGGLLVLAFFLLSLTLSGGFFASLQFISGASWSVVIRRIPEMTVSLLPYVGVLFLILFLGIGELYEWSHEEVVDKDHVLQQKKAFLNIPFFIGRIILYFVIWYILGNTLKKNSLKQDQTKDPALRSKLTKIGAGYIIAFAYFFSLASIDLVMSLEPHWYSTMFPIYTFASLAYSGVAGLIILASTIKKHGGLEGVTGEHFHDLGKFLFMFTVFWAYIALSQFLLIWYANLPEETIYLERRFGMRLNEPSWSIFTILFWIGHFAVPFFVLLSREIKRDHTKLVKIAWFCLFMGFVNTVWMVYGGLHIHGFPFSWMEAGLFLGSVGIFGSLFFHHFSKVNQIPIGDPRLQESLKFHQSH